jgi:hypothetical protein
VTIFKRSFAGISGEEIDCMKDLSSENRVDLEKKSSYDAKKFPELETILTSWL